MTASFDILLQTLLSGVLIGLIYALVAVGLTMIFGVMNIVNFAHGEFLMLGMYASFWGFALWALDPMFTLPLTALMLFALGAAIYHLVIRRIIRAPMLSQIFTTFGLMILFRGLAQFLWKPDFRTIEHTIVQGKVAFAGLQFGLPQLVAGGGASAVTGVAWQKMFARAWGIGAACAGIAGALLSTFFPIFPEVGANFILVAFVTVALGGFGSVAGAFWAGIIVGIVEVLGGFLLGPQYKLALVLALYLLVVLLRPQGLLGRA